MSHSHAKHDPVAVEFAIGGDFSVVGLWAGKSHYEEDGVYA